MEHTFTCQGQHVKLTEAGPSFGPLPRACLFAEILRLAERVKELEAGSAPDALALVASNVRAERAHIRRELLETISAEVGTYYNGGEIALRAVGVAALLAALDHICPEEK